MIRHPYITVSMSILGLMLSASSHILPSRHQDGLLQEADNSLLLSHLQSFLCLHHVAQRKMHGVFLQHDPLSSSASGWFAIYPSILNKDKCSIPILKNPENDCISIFANNKVPSNSVQGAESTYFTSSAF